MKIFNLKQDDFSTLREFNDYLEQVEIYVMNLTYDLDVESTKRQIETFSKTLRRFNYKKQESHEQR